MASIYHRGLKRCYIDDEVDLLTSNKIRRFHEYHRDEFEQSAQYRKKIKQKKKKKKDVEEEEYHCQVYLKLYPATCKCTLDVIVKSTNDILDDQDLILLAKTRIAKVIQPGVIRVRLVSSLFLADVDVHEDSSLIKLETIRREQQNNSFDKQFALKLKNNRIGPGVIGKLFLESLDPSNGSYSNESPIFELNLTLASEHEIVLPSLHQNTNHHSICGCLLSSDESRSIISDQCNLKFNDMKLLHRLAEPLRCQWKLIGRELAPCFSEMDLIDIQQTYFTSDGNHECTYQLLREWYIREPSQANIRHLITRLKLPFDLLVKIHDDIVRTFRCCCC